MTHPIIKICGLSTPDTVQTAVDAGADMIGFVFFPKSPRNVSIGQAKELSNAAGGAVQVVALTVNMNDRDLATLVSSLKPDILQLHGTESVERCHEVRERFKLPIMKAFGISGPGDLDRVQPYAQVVDRFLFDAKPPQGSSLPGGNGVPFDWRLLKDLDLGVPYMLSGGLTIDNVSEALATSGAPGVDVSSGVEREKGVKDAELIKTFVQRARDTLS